MKRKMTEKEILEKIETLGGVFDEVTTDWAGIAWYEFYIPGNSQWAAIAPCGCMKYWSPCRDGGKGNHCSRYIYSGYNGAVCPHCGTDTL